MNLSRLLVDAGLLPQFKFSLAQKFIKSPSSSILNSGLFLVGSNRMLLLTVQHYETQKACV
jgi:hypothetical protein